jgi:hypothetical protein
VLTHRSSDTGAEVEIISTEHDPVAVARFDALTVALLRPQEVPLSLICERQSLSIVVPLTMDVQPCANGTRNQTGMECEVCGGYLYVFASYREDGRQLAVNFVEVCVHNEDLLLVVYRGGGAQCKGRTLEFARPELRCIMKSCNLVSLSLYIYICVGAYVHGVDSYTYVCAVHPPSKFIVYP